MPNGFSLFMVDTANIKDGAITAPKINANAILRSKVKRTQTTVSGSLAAGAQVVIAMHDTNFFPCVYEDGIGKTYMKAQHNLKDIPEGNFALRNDDTTSRPYNVTWAYISET